MKKLINYVFLLPLAIVLILVSVANRQWVRFSLDPLNSENPAVSLELPFFVFLFLALLAGMMIGGILVWLSQGKHRKALREKSFEAQKLKREHDAEAASSAKPAEEIAPGLPLISRN